MGSGQFEPLCEARNIRASRRRNVARLRILLRVQNRARRAFCASQEEREEPGNPHAIMSLIPRGDNVSEG